MASKKIRGITIEIGGDTTKLGKAIESAEQKTKSLEGELKDVERLLKMDPGNTDLLAQRQRLLAEAVSETADKLDVLKKAEKQVQEQFKRGEVSEEQVRSLQREIVRTEQKMDSYKSSVDGAEDKVDELGKTTEKTEGITSNLGSTLVNVAKTGLTAVATATTAVIGALTASAEGTRDYRNEMAKLDTAFKMNGHSAESAQATYKTLQGVLGDTEQAVEASNHLAQLCKNEEDLSTWTEIATGVYGMFGASLPLEALTEASNESAKVGQVTGALADALNWASVDATRWSGILEDNKKAQKAFNKAIKEGASVEDAFNEALKKCSSEQERAQLITDALSGAYQEEAWAFQDANAEVIRANEANEEWMATMAEVGGAVEPVLTDVKLLGASLLSELVPGVKAVTDAFRGILNGEEGATGQLGEALSGIFSQLLTKITESLPMVAETAVSLISTLVTTITGQIPRLLSVGGQIIGNLLTGIVNNLPQIASSAMGAIERFVSGIQTYLPIVIQRGREILTNLGNGIRENLPSLVSRALDALMKFATTIYDNAPSIIDAGFDLLSNLVKGILNSLPVLLSKGPEIISKFANVINDNFPKILKKGIQLIGEIIKGIIRAIPTLIANVPKIITAIVDVWEAFNWLQLGRKAITLLKDGILKMIGAVKSAGKSIANGLTNILKELPSKLLNLGKSMTSNLGNALRTGWSNIKTGASTIFNGIVNYFKDLPGKLLSVGKDLVKGLWNGISDMTGWIVGKIRGFGDSVLSGIKDFFGIKSPSRVFRDEVGAMLATGLAEGIEENANEPLGAMTDLSNDILREANGLNGLTFERQLNTTFGTGSAGLAIDNGALLDKLNGIYDRLGRMQIVLDTGILVGETIDKIDAGLGVRQQLVARGV